jgi:glucose-6-phosphate-specific signal transduction histidine kinase
MAMEHFLQKVGHFLWHYVQMCLACCVGGMIMSVAFFGGPALIGYPDLIAQAPYLSTLVLAINVSVPMVAWMRFRHHEWRPTLEMAGAPMGLGTILVAGGLLGIIPVSDMFEWVTSLACPVMLVPMLLRFNHYAGGMSHHAPAA